MDRTTNKIHREIFGPAHQLLGSWEMCHSFPLDGGGDVVVNAVEKYQFTESGTGEYAYTDDSNFETESSSRFSFKVDGGRIFFKIRDSFDIENSLEYTIEGNRLILNYGGSEEVYIRQTK